MGLKKLLRKPNNLQHITDFDSKQHQTEESLKSIYRNRYVSPGKPLPSRITSVQINGHTHTRWNERVGPSFTKDELESLFNDLIRIPYRITTLSDDIAVIDDEIVFIYKFTNDKLVILTIYGRISLKPSLQGLSELKRFNYQQYDKLKLSLPAEVLEAQFPPPIPDDVYFFKGSHTTYRLETYKGCENRCEKIFLTTFTLDGNQHMREILLQSPELSKLNNKVLYVLYSYGHQDYVYQHIKHHDPSKIEKMEQKQKEKELKEAEQLLSEEKQPELIEEETEDTILQKLSEYHRQEAAKQEEAEFNFFLRVFGSPV